MERSTKKRDAYEKRKQGLYAAEAWDSEELKNLTKPEFPIAAGACKAYRAWSHSIEKGNEELEMDDFLWDREVTDFIDTLRKAGIETFVYTNQSTAVMENIHDFEANGCRLDGLTKIHRMENRYGEDEETTIPGIRFSL